MPALRNANRDRGFMLGVLVAVGCMVLSTVAHADSESCGQGDAPPCPIEHVTISGSSLGGYTMGPPGQGQSTPAASGTIGGVSIAQIMVTYKPPCASSSTPSSNYFSIVLGDCQSYVRTYVPWYQLVTPYNEVGRLIEAACQPAVNSAYRDPPLPGSGRCKE